MTLVDTHCHLDFHSYDEIRADVIREAAEVGVTRIINPGTDLERCHKALRIAEQYPNVYAAVGIHPTDTADFDDATLAEVRAMAAHEKVLAIGEIGLDYHWDTSPKSAQWRALKAQLTLAAELELPVIIHNREASDDVLRILAEWTGTLPASLRGRAGVLHSFSAPWSVAERALELGFYIGFTGPVTFKNAGALRRVAAHVPLDRILVETDGPFLTPEPFRGRRPNRPAYVRYIAERLAALHDLPAANFFAQTTANAERLFRLPPAL